MYYLFLLSIDQFAYIFNLPENSSTKENQIFKNRRFI